MTKLVDEATIKAAISLEAIEAALLGSKRMVLSLIEQSRVTDQRHYKTLESRTE